MIRFAMLLLLAGPAPAFAQDVMATLDETGTEPIVVPVEPDPGTKDEIPPAAPGELRIIATTATSATLEWTAPGDDEMEGTVTRYLLCHQAEPITAFVPKLTIDLPSRIPAGETVTFVVGSLTAGWQLYFALVAVDDGANLSPMSNVVQGEHDTIAPAAVTSVTVTVQTSSSLQASWTETGDDGSTGKASTYEVSWSTTDPATLPLGSWLPGAQHATVAAAVGPAKIVLVHPIGGLLPGTIYYVMVRPFDNMLLEGPPVHGMGMTAGSTPPPSGSNEEGEGSTDGGCGGSAAGSPALLSLLALAFNRKS